LDDEEPDDNYQSSRRITFDAGGGYVDAGNMLCALDADWYRVSLTAGQTI
jgi:hypothetical protein